MNSRTNMIKQDETRKLDYVDCGKSLKNVVWHAAGVHESRIRQASLSQLQTFYMFYFILLSSWQSMLL